MIPWLRRKARPKKGKAPAVGAKKTEPTAAEMMMMMMNDFRTKIY
jgi:hypothetical protein